MPLRKGTSNKTVKENIEIEVAAGKPVRQAVAVAEFKKDESSKGKRGKGK